METGHRHFVEKRPKALNNFIMMEHMLDAAREPMARDARKKIVDAAVIKGGNILVFADDFARLSIAQSFRETMETDHDLALRILSTFKASQVMSRKELRMFLGYPLKGRMFSRA